MCCTSSLHSRSLVVSSLLVVDEGDTEVLVLVPVDECKTEVLMSVNTPGNEVDRVIGIVIDEDGIDDLGINGDDIDGKSVDADGVDRSNVAIIDYMLVKLYCIYLPFSTITVNA